ncbi:MAG TPA: hypothetical protein PLM22_01455 [Candidatus Sabulitectum sp.]|nr:hypothetical protein [Candidatus Sabulitectum sp.]HPJ27568.1 hypothetical protein [Candidatus Sabulitectum sp.]
MTGKKNESTASSSRAVRSLIIVVLIAAFFGFLAKTAMEILNRKMGLEAPAAAMEDEGYGEDSVEVVIPDMQSYEPPELTESGSAVWNPDWKATPCSLYISGEGDIVLDSLPQAPDQSNRATELQLLMELWASHSGYSQSEIDNVWAFSRGETCFVDLPRAPDWDAVVRTIEARFISYTLLFPFVAGEAAGNYEGGIPVRGISSNR